MTRRPVVLLAAVTVLALIVALPALAAKPSAPPGLEKAKVEKTPVTVNGTVEASTDENGTTVYTVTHEGTTYTLEAGPPWFFGTDHPLDQFVGRFVTVDGEVAEGSTELDVQAVDGQPLRDEGRPPWAGGWKRVGEGHPGWSQEKAARFAEKFGGCFPPGHCKPAPDSGSEPEGE